MGHHQRDLLTRQIDPAELDDPGFWTVILPNLVHADEPVATAAGWKIRPTPDFSDGLESDARGVSPQLILSLPQGFGLSLQFCESDIYYFLDGIDLPENGLLGHNDGHCQLPVFRWDEVLMLAPIIQALNPTLPQGAALLLLLPSVCLSENEADAASAMLTAALGDLGLDSALATPTALVATLPGIETPFSLHYVPLSWWETSEGDWVNNSRYSLRSATTVREACWDEPARRRFNRTLRKMGVLNASPSSQPDELPTPGLPS